MLQETNVCASCVPEVKGQPWWILIEKTPRWLRVKVDDVIIADSKEALCVNEAGRLPVYYFPFGDVRSDLLERSESHMDTEHKGIADFYHIVIEGRKIENAVWGYPDPAPKCEGLKGYVSFVWDAVDHWYEEEEEIFVHARDPYTRVDAIASSRHIVVTLNRQVVADSKRPVVLFETGLTPRYYLPKEDIRFEYFTATDSVTQCPYKGIASYWSANVNGRSYEDILWCYENPLIEQSKIKGLCSFYNENVDEMLIDGEPWALEENTRLPYKHTPTDFTNV